MPAPARRAARVFAIGAFVAAAVFFLAPATAIDLWPWQLTPLTSRVIGSFTAQVGIGALLLSLDASISAGSSPGTSRSCGSTAAWRARKELSVAHYEFLTTWCVDAPIERVFDVLQDSAAFPEWWGVTAVEVLEPGGADGLGELARYSWRSVLPYTLIFDARVVRVERPHLIEGQATGELEGVGVWRLFEAPGSTAALYSWRVRTTKRWMNAWGPLPRPAFRWNHDRVMAQGGVGLARRLGASLLLSG